MKTQSVKTILLAGLAGLLFAANVGAAEYVFRDILGNTLPEARCASKQESGERASSDFNVTKFAKRFCEVQGYGWHVSQQSSPGKLVCDACPDSAGKETYKCHMEDVAVTCKRLKPGSVGMFPGQG